MRILFLKLKVIGDALLMTPTLEAVRAVYPEAKIVVVVRKGSEGILAGCRAIDEMHTAEAPEEDRQSIRGFVADTRTVGRLRRMNFDYAFDLGGNDRSRWVTALSGARQKVTVDHRWPQRWVLPRIFDLTVASRRRCHRVEMDFFAVSGVLKIGDEPPPLRFADEKTEPWSEFDRPDEPFVLVHPGTRKPRKAWPEESWRILLQELSNRFPRIVLSSGPDRADRELGRRLAEGWSRDRLVTTEGKLGFRQVAWLLKRAVLFVGVDTAVMHLAAACGCPIIALWGPSNEREWRPWKAPHLLVQPGEADAGGESHWRERSMDSILCADVLAGIDSFRNRKRGVSGSE